MRTVTFKIDEWLLERLDAYARLKCVSRSEVIRKAIEEFLERHGEDVAVKPKIIRVYS